MTFNAELVPHLVLATKNDIQTIQNMWLYYIYDMGRECGFIKGWECPATLGFVADDLSPYFNEPERKGFLIKIKNELAGFVLLRQTSSEPTKSWEMSEFYILAKYQGKGVGGKIALEVWNTHPGYWEVSVIPENKSALAFWREVISAYTGKAYREEIRIIDYDTNQPQRYFLSFNTLEHNHTKEI